MFSIFLHLCASLLHYTLDIMIPSVLSPCCLYHLSSSNVSMSFLHSTLSFTLPLSLFTTSFSLQVSILRSLVPLKSNCEGSAPPTHYRRAVKDGGRLRRNGSPLSVSELCRSGRPGDNL